MVVALPSPYRPGYNQRPVVLAGREDVLAAADEALAVAVLEGRTPPALLVVGPRGVGKTVLLGEIADRAGERYSWPRLHVEIAPGSSLTADLVAGARDLVARFDQQPPSGRFRATSVVVGASLTGVHGEVTLTRSDAASPGGGGEIRVALASVVDAAADRDSGFVLTIDEMQLASRDELGQLAAVLQRATEAAWPVVVVGAGLPGMRDPGRTVSYFERAEWHEIGSLDPRQTRLALEGPAEAAGRPFEDDALDLLADRSGGYPYAVQLYGHHAWRASAGSDRIDLGAARRAATTAQKQLEVGLYANRWVQASGGERNYLVHLARLLAASQSVRGAEVAAALGVTARQVSTVRDRLLKKGTISAEGEYLHFAVPGMSEYVLRQSPDNSPDHELGGKAHRARRQQDDVGL
ncbi:MAG: hypothetical protein QOF30_456 [Acidimicrobiaceae bacterium]|nr:hypothetical protein [Acidimicrobiaceae bacterium]